MRGRILAGLLAVLTISVAIALLLDRGGLIAWIAFLVGAAWLGKVCMSPSPLDAVFCAGTTLVLALGWVGTLAWVIATWESGEVVELSIEIAAQTHTARVWVMDINGLPVVYYDAPPAAAQSLLNGLPVRFTRGDETSMRIPEAREVDSIPSDEVARLLSVMTDKYGDRVAAADLYYMMLGRPKDRVAVVASLSPE